MIARSVGGVEGAVSGKAEGGSGSSDRKVTMESATVHSVGAERDDGIEVTKHR